MKIEVYSDIACPWCHVGERRLEQALAEYAGQDELEVVFLPYQLDPDAPDTPIPMREHLARRFGAVARTMADRVSATAAGEGIVMDWGRALAVNTFSAHRLARHARLEYGPDVQRALMRKLFTAHFAEGRDVSDYDQLVELAGSVGINANRARNYLASGEGSDELRQELAQARGSGIQAVPTFVIDDRFMIQGAQPAATFLELFAEVERRQVSPAG